MELDFHGKTWVEARAEFRNAYDATVRAGGTARTLRVIHGYGSSGVGGVLGLRFWKHLQRQGARLTFKLGEETDGNPGWTLVQAVSPLQDEAEILEDQILDYCREPRSRRKIYGKFRRYGDPQVQQALRSLLAAPPMLIKVDIDGREGYQAV